MYAIVEISGKQYKVKENDFLYVPRQHVEENEKLSFENVLLISDGDAIQVGQPTVGGAKVDATVVAHVKSDKVLVFKKKRRKRYRVTRGHRQPYTRIKIDSVSVKG